MLRGFWAFFGTFTKMAITGVSHARTVVVRDESGQKHYIIRGAFYALHIAHRRSISPPTIMDRFLDQLMTSLILEKKVTSDDLGGQAERARSGQIASRSGQNIGINTSGYYNDYYLCCSALPLHIHILVCTLED